MSIILFFVFCFGVLLLLAAISGAIYGLITGLRS